MSRLSVTVLDDYESMSRAAAALVCEVVAKTERASVVFAMGHTPMGLYRELARRHQAGTFEASKVRPYQLDEYDGIEPDDSRSLFGWMRRSVLEPLGIPADDAVRLPTGATDDEFAAHDRATMEQGGLDLTILGIGENGHLGFNEPPSEAAAPTRQVKLSAQTIDSNHRYWGNDITVPDTAITLGMRSILASKHVVLVASGAHKRAIVHQALHGAVTEDIPASYLQRAAKVTVFLDRDAWGAPGSGS